MLSTFGRTVGNPSATLTRIHFHSLTYHVIATVRDTWQNSLSAVTAGARAASLQACDTSSFANDKFSLKIPKSLKLSESIALKFDPHKPGISWEEEDLEFSFSPVLVCKEPTRTVGLGDAISATGLMYSYRTNLWVIHVNFAYTCARLGLIHLKSSSIHTLFCQSFVLTRSGQAFLEADVPIFTSNEN